jgi:hypothetical protein
MQTTFMDGAKMLADATRLVILAIAISFGAESQAASLNVVGGQLLGASDVIVDGSLYDVEFLGGTCIALFNGCDDVSDFMFQSQAAAISASQALLDQVFLDGASGNFDSLPQLSLGCSDSSVCHVLTPHGFTVSNPGIIDTSDVRNLASLTPDNDTILMKDNVATLDLATSTNFTYAVWSRPVPEPSTALLMGFGLTGLSWAGRRRNRS